MLLASCWRIRKEGKLKKFKRLEALQLSIFNHHGSLSLHSHSRSGRYGKSSTFSTKMSASSNHQKAAATLGNSFGDLALKCTCFPTTPADARSIYDASNAGCGPAGILFWQGLALEDSHRHHAGTGEPHAVFYSSVFVMPCIMTMTYCSRSSGVGRWDFWYV